MRIRQKPFEKAGFFNCWIKRGDLRHPLGRRHLRKKPGRGEKHIEGIRYPWYPVGGNQ